ncbi:group III truncated hemoglobin [Phreatobacter sp.]|uniref:group III truncated hemoglobin n=1 Tax=Phreatobacter sp. TaxID=1966341 RepID=UPI0026005CB3|nr:group III truncated hemoglobin [Phreatobacter sp.]
MLIDGRLLPEALGVAMIEAVVRGFYAEIRADDVLGPVFNGAIAGADWPEHLSRTCDFGSVTLIRTGRYTGRPLPLHLALPGLGEEHFRRWLALFRVTLHDPCPPEIASLFMDRALRIAHSFRLAIAFRRNEDSLAVRPILEEIL